MQTICSEDYNINTGSEPAINVLIFVSPVRPFLCPAGVLCGEARVCGPIWRAAIRRVGVPDKYRARFWDYVMFGSSKWLPVSTHACGCTLCTLCALCDSVATLCVCALYVYCGDCVCAFYVLCV